VNGVQQLAALVTILVCATAAALVAVTVGHANSHDVVTGISALYTAVLGYVGGHAAGKAAS